MNFGEAMMRWSVRFSVLLMLAAWLLMIPRPQLEKTRTTARWIWTVGWLAFLIHLWAAFEFVHHWSHAAAIRETAKQTKVLAGFEWGGGVWANYLFAVMWGVDVLWRWLAPENFRRRPSAVRWLVHGYLGFITFNATVVFATGFSRWLGVAGCVFLLMEVNWKRSETVECDDST